MADDAVKILIEAFARPLTGAQDDYNKLLELIGNAYLVLLGEATHGTHEFYRARAQITKRLIAEKSFAAIAVEADWPDADFKRFPAWIWRNADVLDFVGWLRDYNDGLAPGATKVGFYGLDLYSLHRSIDAVLAYLDKVDPEAARRARHRYSCFEDFGEDAQAYGYAAGVGLTESCEDEVIGQLIEMQRRAAELGRRDERKAANEFFFAEQNARLVKNAEQYFRMMFHGRISAWNLRDRHMAETIDALIAHHGGQNRRAKLVIWEHNSHLGDARATEMGERGEWNVGQLVREKYGFDSVIVGFTTHSGTVTAASDWGGPAERKRVRPALAGSYEALFHEIDHDRFVLGLRHGGMAAANLRTPRLERAIGVIYRPETERHSHYFNARMSEQFDAILHFDRTRAVEPLERTSEWEREEVPYTYPSGM
jgi:erythromycin esterase-like protein